MDFNYLFGTEGSDSFVPRIGANRTSQGADVVFAYGGDDVVRVAGGVDYVYAGGGEDTIFGGAGGDYLYGYEDNDTIHGGDDNDTVYGGSGHDDLYGDDGADKLFGEDGNDHIYGGAGADEMRGGDGSDYYEVRQAGDTVIEAAGEGHDAVSSFVSFTLGANVEDLYLTGAGAVEGTGNGLANLIGGDDNVNNVLRGNGGADKLYGFGGDDTLFGGGAGDELDGGEGDDTLRGQDGDDFLHGWLGADELIGGTGNDVFYFNTALTSLPGAGNRDTIKAGDGASAFQGAGVAGGDRIDLSDFDGNQLTGGHQALIWGGAGGGADMSKGHVWTVNVSGDTYLRANIDNDAAAEFEVRIIDGGVSANDYGAGDFVFA